MRRILLIGGLALSGAFLQAKEPAPPQEADRMSYARKAEAEIAELNKQVAALQKRSERAGSETRDELNEQMRRLQDKLDAARQKLADLQESGGSWWERLRRALDRITEILKSAYRKLVSYVRS